MVPARHFSLGLTVRPLLPAEQKDPGWPAALFEFPGAEGTGVVSGRGEGDAPGY